MIELAASFESTFSPLAPFLIYLILFAVIFCETGIVFGFFLPGDSILFSAGLVAASRNDINIVILVLLIFLAAFLGDQVGFVLGRKIGRPYMDKRTSPRMIKLVARAELFYDKYGWWAVVTARFFPWIRSFVPPIAGAARMNYYKFLSANTLGALLWGVGITLAGYYAARFPWVKSSSYALAFFFIGASFVSVAWKYHKSKREVA